MINGYYKTLIGLAVFLALSGTALAAFSYVLNPIPNPPQLNTGERTTVSVSIKSTNYLYDGRCAYKLDSGLLSDEYYVSPGVTVARNITIHAPREGSGSGSAQHTVYVYCYESAYSGDPKKIYENTSFILFYDDTRYQTRTAINSAQVAIDSAQSIINNSVIIIDQARNIGADVTPAENKLSSSIKYLQTAQARQSFAKSFFDDSDYNQSKAFANDAKSSADLAKADADVAYTIAAQANQIREAEDAIQAEQNSSEEDKMKSRQSKRISGETVNKTGGAESSSGWVFKIPSFEIFLGLSGLSFAYSAILRRGRKK